MQPARIITAPCLAALLIAATNPAASGQLHDPYSHIGGAEGIERYPKSTAYPIPRYRTPATVSRITPTPGNTASAGRDSTPAPPAQAQQAPARLVSRKLTIEERVGEASRQQDVAESSVRADTAALLKDMKRAIAGYERAPKWDGVEESLRLEKFIRLLEHGIKLGKAAGQDKESIEKSVARWKALSKQAAPVYSEAAASFRELAKGAEFAEERKLFEGAANYYAARATRAELQAAHVVPESVTTQLRRIEKMTKAMEVLLGYVEADPHYLKKNSEADGNIVAFTEAFNGINAVLSDWTTTLLKDMERANESEKSKALPPEVVRKPSA